jgi:hypothetical protein
VKVGNNVKGMIEWIFLDENFRLPPGASLAVQPGILKVIVEADSLGTDLPGPLGMHHRLAHNDVLITGSLGEATETKRVLQRSLPRWKASLIDLSSVKTIVEEVREQARVHYGDGVTVLAWNRWTRRKPELARRVGASPSLTLQVEVYRDLWAAALAFPDGAKLGLLKEGKWIPGPKPHFWAEAERRITQGVRSDVEGLIQRGATLTLGADIASLVGSRAVEKQQSPKRWEPPVISPTSRFILSMSEPRELDKFVIPGDADAQGIPLVYLKHKQRLAQESMPKENPGRRRAEEKKREKHKWVRLAKGLKPIDVEELRGRRYSPIAFVAQDPQHPLMKQPLTPLELLSMGVTGQEPANAKQDIYVYVASVDGKVLEARFPGFEWIAVHGVPPQASSMVKAKLRSIEPGEVWKHFSHTVRRPTS